MLDQNLKISAVENEVLLRPVKYFETSFLQSHKNKQFWFICLSIAMNMSNTILFREFRYNHWFQSN